MERIEAIESTVCDHQWRYFVNVESKAVSARRCERCGERRLLVAAAEKVEAALQSV